MGGCFSSSTKGKDEETNKRPKEINNEQDRISAKKTSDSNGDEDSFGTLPNVSDEEEADEDFSSRYSSTFGRNSHFKINISHMKARGSIFEEHACEFFLKIRWDDETQESPLVKGSVSSKGCSWSDYIMTFEYQPQESRFRMSQSLCELKRSSQNVLHKKSESEGDDTPRLTVACYGVRHFHIHKSQTFLVGEYSIDLFTVMSGPIHHVFKLKSERDDVEHAQISYNVRIKQYALWHIDLHSLKVTYDDIHRKKHGVYAPANVLVKSNVDQIQEMEPFVRPPSLPTSLVLGDDSGVIDSIKGRDFSLDKSKKFLIKYRLDDLSQAMDISSNHSVYPEVDSIGMTYIANWDAAKLPCICHKDEIPFKSFLTTSVSFQLYELESESTASSRKLNVKAPAREASGSQDISHVDSLGLAITDGKLLGEVWVSIERLFENALEEAIHDRKIDGATTSFKYELRYLGSIVGTIEGECEFLPIPGCLPLGRGVLTEEGISLMPPVIFKDNAALLSVNSKSNFMKRFRGNSADFGNDLSLGGKKLIAAVKDFEKNFVRETPGKKASKTDAATSEFVRDMQIRACKELLEAINTSEKESTTAFVYKTERSLLQMQQLMMSLWQNIIDWTDTVRYSFRVVFFDILASVLMRGELSEHMMPVMVERLDTSDKENTTALVALKYRAQCYTTLSWALRKLALKGNPDEVRNICGKIAAIMTFRLPDYGKLVYEAIMPEKETDIKEWSNSSKLKSYVTEGSSHFSTPEFVSHVFSLDKPNQTSKPSPDGTESHGLLDWRPFHAKLEAIFGREALHEQEQVVPMGNMKEGVFQSPMWLRRIQKHGEFFFVLGCEWMIYVLDTLGGLATSFADNVEGAAFQSGITWHKIHGYKHILKAFLLELRRRDLESLPESFRKLGMLLLVDDHLITTFSSIAITKTNVYSIDCVTASLDLLSSWLTTLHGWPGRFVALRLFRKKGPLTPAQADDALRNSTSVFFNAMKERKRKRLESDADVAEALDLTSHGDEIGHLLEVQPVPAPMAQMRAMGSLVPQRLPNLEPKIVHPPGMYPGSYHHEPEKLPEPYVTAWTFDMVSIYYPHLDVYRRAYKQSSELGKSNKVTIPGLAKNNNFSNCNWFSWLYAETPPVLPPNFDYRLLLHSFYILLQADHHQVVLKTIEFIYNHWESFAESFQDRFRLLLLTPLSDPYGAGSAGNEMWRSDPVLTQANGKVTHGNSIYLQLFFHWTDDVRHFFHTLVAYRLCRGAKTAAMLKILSQIQLCLMAADPNVVDALWHSCHDHSHAVNIEQYVVGAALARKFEGMASSEKRGGISSYSKKKDNGNAGRNIRSYDTVNMMIRDIEKDANVESAKHDTKMVEHHLQITGQDKWPERFKPYAVSSSAMFRKVLKTSLDPNQPMPVLEWTVVVMDRGEMRSVGGLSIFNK